MSNQPKIDREELAWAAGFFDGEGNISVQRHKYKDREHFNLHVSVSQTEEEPLTRFRNAVLGLGKVYGPYNYNNKPGRENCKQVWRFSTQSFETGQAIIAMLWPFLGGTKRTQAEEALKTMGEYHGG